LLYLAGGRLGDALLAAAFVRHYRAWFGRPIVAVGRPETAAVLAPLVDRFVAFAPEASDASPHGFAAARAALPTEAFGILGDLHVFHGNLRCLDLAAAVPANLTVAYDGWIDRNLQAPIRPWPAGIHLVPSLAKPAGTDPQTHHLWRDLGHYHRAALDAFGLDAELPTTPWLPSELSSTELHGVALPPRYVGCHADSSQGKKDLALARWVSVFAACPDTQFVLLGQNDHALPSTLPNVLDLRGRTSIAQATTIAAHSAVFLGVDSGLAHAAAIAGVPTIVAMAQATPGYFFPYPADLARDTVTLRAEEFAACAGCGGICGQELLVQSHRHGFPCVRALRPSAIVDALRAALKKLTPAVAQVCGSIRTR
jgi:ADP-heptose:LPS heptosyltransferase